MKGKKSNHPTFEHRQSHIYFFQDDREHRAGTVQQEATASWCARCAGLVSRLPRGTDLPWHLDHRRAISNHSTSPGLGFPSEKAGLKEALNTTSVFILQSSPCLQVRGLTLVKTINVDLQYIHGQIMVYDSTESLSLITGCRSRPAQVLCF